MIKCDICHFNNPDGIAYCGRCGNGLSSPDEMADTFISSAIEGERKQVTVIFADISGFTALNDAAKTPSEVEKVLQIVNHCLHMLSEVVYEYDGYIDKYMGDAIMAVFGAPRSHEDDPERALRTALAMRERLDDFNRNPPFPLAEPLGIHLGINTGTVIAGLIGTKRKRSYTVMGDAVNVASRLEGVSERGEVLVSQDTYHLTSRLFTFKEREPVYVKGKKEPLIIYELVKDKHQYSTQRGIAGLRSAMVGREKEFELLNRQINGLGQNKGSIITIIGEAGLGKSRLVSELQQQLVRDGYFLMWLEGRGLSYRQNQSYKLFIEILRKYLNVNPDEPGDLVWQKWKHVGPELFGARQNEVVPYLAMLMGIKLDEKVTQTMPLSDPGLLQQRLFIAVGEWVETIARLSPLVLVFEDLHWADPSSIALIDYLMTQVPRLPLLLICIIRPDKEAHFWPLKTEAARQYPAFYYELQLEPLTQKQSRSLVDQLLQVERIPRELEKLILNRSEGNPLFMEEVLRSLIEDGTLVKEGDSWRMARPVTEVNIPETLTGVLTSRIDRLDEPVKRTLQIASVVGRVFPRSVLEAVCDDVAENKTQLDDYLETLVTAELVRRRASDTEQEYIFKHVLTYETTYNTLLVQQRRVYHKRIADHMAPLYYLKGEEYAAIVAQHYEQGEVWDRALTYLIRAAEASKTTFDNVNAVDFYTKALEVSQLVENLKPKTLMQIYEGRGDILKRLGKIDQAREDIETVLRLAQENQAYKTQMRALGELGNLHAARHKFSQAAGYFEDALNIARQAEDQKGLVDALNQLGDFELTMGQLNQCSAHFYEALDYAQTLENTRRVLTSQDGLAAVLLYQGEIAAAIDRLNNTARTWRDIGNYQGLMKAYLYLATAYTWQADYAPSDEICHNALEIEERTGDLNWASNFRYCLAQNAFARGDLPQANTHFAKAIDLSRQLGNGVWQTMGLLGSGLYHLTVGQRDVACRQIQDANRLAEETGSPLWMSRARRAAGTAHRFKEELPQAETILQAELGLMEQMGFALDQVDILSELLDVLIGLNRWEELPGKINRLTELIAAGELKAYRSPALLASAQLAAHHGQLEEACRFCRQAEESAAQTDSKLAQINANLHLAELYRQDNRPEQAQAGLAAAEQLLTAMAGAFEDKTARNHLLARSPVALKLTRLKQLFSTEKG